MFMYVQFMDMLFILLAFGSVWAISRFLSSPWLGLAAPVVCFIILFMPLTNIALHHVRPVRVSDIRGAQIGDVVSLGHFDGEPLLWRIVDENDGRQTLIAVRNVAYRPFNARHTHGEPHHDTNANDWVTSDLRAWLNGDFLALAFGAEPPLLSSRDMLLTARTRHYAERGDRDFYAFHVPAYAFRGTDRAYRMTVHDHVRLPDAHVMRRLMDMGGPIRGGYWLEIPRFLCGEAMRYVSRDGFVMVADAERPMGIRPVIEIERR
jgi:hypothetical protein